MVGVVEITAPDHDGVMDIFLIWGFVPEGSGGFVTLSSAWDGACQEINPEGYRESIEQAERDYGSEYVTITKATIDHDRVKALFDLPAQPQGIGDLHLIWRIEDGELEVVDGWDDDTIAENPGGWEAEIEGVGSDVRITSHRIDFDAVIASLQPQTVPFA